MARTARAIPHTTHCLSPHRRLPSSPSAGVRPALSHTDICPKKSPKCLILCQHLPLSFPPPTSVRRTGWCASPGWREQELSRAPGSGSGAGSLCWLLPQVDRPSLAAHLREKKTVLSLAAGWSLFIFFQRSSCSFFEEDFLKDGFLELSGGIQRINFSDSLLTLPLAGRLLVFST